MAYKRQRKGYKDSKTIDTCDREVPTTVLKSLGQSGLPGCSPELSHSKYKPTLSRLPIANCRENENHVKSNTTTTVM